MRTKGNAEELFQRRLKVVRRVEDDGLTQAAAAAEAGVHRNSVGAWCRAHAAGGAAALRGVHSPPGRPPGLSPRQVRDVVRCIVERGAKRCGFDTDLWTLPRIARLIEQRHGVRYDVDHLSRLVRRWGLSWQRPDTKPFERDEAKIQHWLTHDWPRIKKK